MEKATERRSSFEEPKPLCRRQHAEVYGLQNVEFAAGGPAAIEPATRTELRVSGCILDKSPLPQRSIRTRSVALLLRVAAPTVHLLAPVMRAASRVLVSGMEAGSQRPTATIRSAWSGLASRGASPCLRPQPNRARPLDSGHLGGQASRTRRCFDSFRAFRTEWVQAARRRLALQIARCVIATFIRAAVPSGCQRPPFCGVPA